MVGIKAGIIGPAADGVTPYNNPADIRRAETWYALGARSGVLRGLIPAVIPGQMQLALSPGAALVAERDGSNVELDRGYLAYTDVNATVQFGAASASARNDAVVIAVVDVEDGAQGTGVIGVGGHLVVVPGQSGVSTPRTDAQIQSYLGRGGWHRYADVAIPAAPQTQIQVGNIALKYVRLNTGSSRLLALKQVVETVTASQTLQSDDDLKLDLPVGTWDIVAKLGVTCSSGVAADIKVAWAFSGTTSGAAGRFCQGPRLLSTDSTDTTMRSTSHGLATAVAYGVEDVTTAYIEEHLCLTVTVAGTLNLQWAQNGVSASTTTMAAGSRVLATRVD